MTTTDYEPNMVLSNVEYKVVGTRPIRHDGHDKVTGRALYGADFTTAGLLHAKVLRSPHAHAKIKSIDPSKALAMPGVRAVVTASDLPPSDGDVGKKRERDNILASDKVLYKGHAVAGVAAEAAYGPAPEHSGRRTLGRLSFAVDFLVVAHRLAAAGGRRAGKSSPTQVYALASRRGLTGQQDRLVSISRRSPAATPDRRWNTSR